jgi:hypothetical protein
MVDAVDLRTRFDHDPKGLPEPVTKTKSGNATEVDYET